MPDRITREKIKGYKPRACCFNRIFHIMAKIWRSTICSDNKEHDFCLFVGCFLPSSFQLNVLQCDIAIWLWICNICTTYNREWRYDFPRILHYLANSRKQYYKLNGKNTKNYLKCISIGIFQCAHPTNEIHTNKSPSLFLKK